MGMGVQVGLVLVFLHVRRVLGLIFVSFIFFSMLKDRVLFIMY